MLMKFRDATKTEYPFKFKLEGTKNQKLMESYTGVYIVVHVSILFNTLKLSNCASMK